MSGRSGRWLAAVIVAGALVHGVSVGFAWRDAQAIHGGKDYASYHYAAVAAHEGADPYNTPGLARRARLDGRRIPINPYFYPPPFLLLVAWSPYTSLEVAYRLWFWLSEAASLVAIGATVALTRPLGRWSPALVLVAVALCTAFADNLRMGQANLVVLAITLTGLWAARPERDEVGAGVLLGVACMWKMSPALFVLHWLVQGRYKPVIASVLAALVASVATLPLLDLAHQWRFFRHVLPGFGTGDYNGLIVPITLFGNHSIPNVYAQLFPGNGDLGVVARMLSSGTAFGMVVGTMIAFRTASDEFQRVAQVAAIAVLMLLVPVYTYEHHVVWALPAVVVAGMALVEGRLPRWTAAPFVLAACVWGLDLGIVRSLALEALRIGWWLEVPVQEAKFVALGVLFALCAKVGSTQG